MRILSILVLACFCTSIAVAEKVQVGDMQLHYTVEGKGESLLLLHGLTTSGHDSWRVLAPLLAKHFRVYVLDMRGHGHSTFSKKLFTHQQSAKDILTFLSKPTTWMQSGSSLPMQERAGTIVGHLPNSSSD